MCYCLFVFHFVSNNDRASYFISELFPYQKRNRVWSERVNIATVKRIVHLNNKKRTHILIPNNYRRCHNDPYKVSIHKQQRWALYHDMPICKISYSHLRILFIDPIHMCTVVKCKQHKNTCCKLNIPVVVRKISIQRIKIEDEWQCTRNKNRWVHVSTFPLLSLTDCLVVQPVV